VQRDRRRAVWLNAAEYPLDVARNGDGIQVNFLADNETTHFVKLKSDWKPGMGVWTGTVDKEQVAVQVRPVANGFKLSFRGAQIVAYVYTATEAQAAKLMPVKQAGNSGKLVLCPMPGLVVSIAVKEGQEVKAGDQLAIVEAMKMENVIRAERDATVKKVAVKAGDSLAVDAVILEFA
jgi:propionyl-CoA carboxylase alpha chain